MSLRVLSIALLLVASFVTVRARADDAGPKPPKPDLGFGAAFDAELKRIGQISPADFAKRFPAPNGYLDKLSWDSATSQYWDRYMLDPKNAKLKKAVTPEQLAPFDFRVNDAELALLKKNGFVVSERRGAQSFTDLYYRIYVRDLPVFVTADSMLHAWHRYFDRFLERMEADYFHPMLKEMLAAMQAQIPKLAKTLGDGPLSASVQDIDVFIAVARELLERGKGATVLNQNERFKGLVEACFAEKMFEYPLFGRPRTIDFSQFKPRGRYDKHDWSQSYFRAMMWLGRIDLRIAGNEEKSQDMRELGSAVVMNELLRKSNMTEKWRQFDRFLTQLVGRADSLTFSQLGELLTSAKIADISQATPEKLDKLYELVKSGRAGQQEIRGEWFVVDPNDPKKLVLPNSFCFLGQRFVLDSWALTKVVYDDIFWDGKKVKRRIPSAADMAFAVFANDHLSPMLVRRMTDAAGRRFRDGENYQHNLAAVRNVIDRLGEAQWGGTIYAEWLACLRELSRPTTDAKYPEAMRTQPWAMKSTTTQLASWTQLRHDTILYAKPSYTTGESCSYPAGFVEPIPHFWKRLEHMVARTKKLVDSTPFPDRRDGEYKTDGAEIKKYATWGLDGFAKATSMLRVIAEKELKQQELTKDETKFLQDIVVPDNMSGAPPIGGWYPNLFLDRSTIRGQDDAHKWVALVTDVHTNPPAPPSGDPGCVINQGVGSVDLMLIAVDNGKDRTLYAGPVFSHYEFETPNAVRLTNGDWQERLRKGEQPKRPEWSRGYVVTGVPPGLRDYGKEDNKRVRE